MIPGNDTAAFSDAAQQACILDVIRRMTWTESELCEMAERFCFKYGGSIALLVRTVLQVGQQQGYTKGYNECQELEERMRQVPSASVLARAHVSKAVEEHSYDDDEWRGER